MEKNLYPFKFVPVASRRPWGGNALVRELGKKFVECDDDGNEKLLGEDVLIGESWEIAVVRVSPTTKTGSPSTVKQCSSLKY